MDLEIWFLNQYKRLKEAEMKIAMFAYFKEYHGNHKNFKSLYGVILGGAVSK